MQFQFGVLLRSAIDAHLKIAVSSSVAVRRVDRPPLGADEVRQPPLPLSASDSEEPFELIVTTQSTFAVA